MAVSYNVIITLGYDNVCTYKVYPLPNESLETTVHDYDPKTTPNRRYVLYSLFTS